MRDMHTEHNTIPTSYHFLHHVIDDRIRPVESLRRNPTSVVLLISHLYNNQSRRVTVLLLITRPSTTKSAYTDCNTVIQYHQVHNWGVSGGWRGCIFPCKVTNLVYRKDHISFPDEDKSLGRRGEKGLFVSFGGEVMFIKILF